VFKLPICGLLLLELSILSVRASDSADPCTPPNFPLPTFGTAKVNVRDLGATGNGRSNDTAAINKAIEQCSAHVGGGDVIFDPGTYSAASIHLKSNVRFVLDKDAVITGAQSGYDPPEPNPFSEYQDFGHSHFRNALMWGENIENFAIVGGRVNGGHIIEGEPAGRDVGDKVIALKSSRNLLFDNVVHETGGHFVYLLNDCENVTLSNITIRKSRDAVNLVGCRDVQLHHCSFTGCGDDTLALKSDWALGRKILSENIYVWDSYFESACNALMFGAETTGDFRNINFWSIRIGRAWKAAIGIISADGGIIDGANYRDIEIKDAACPILMHVTSKLRSGDPDKKAGSIRNVRITNVTVTDCKRGETGWPRTCLLLGEPDSLLKNISLENVRVALRGGGNRDTKREVLAELDRNRVPRDGSLPAGGFYLKYMEGVTLKDVKVRFESADSRPALMGSEINNLTLDGFDSGAPSRSQALELEKVDGLIIRNSPGLDDRSDIQVDKK